MKKLIFVAAIIVIAGFFLFSKDTDQTASVINNLAGDEPITETGGNTGVTMQEAIITYTDAGYAPKEVTIKKGNTVKFMNSSSEDMWPASAMHPSHAVYPGSGIEKCGSAEEPNIFDACRRIPVGSSYSFTFNEVGSWGFHDHRNPTRFGKITVTAE